MKISRKYKRVLRREFGYLATWLPGRPIELGDIGIMKNKQFHKISNISELGISFEEEPDETKDNLEYQNQNQVLVTQKLSGDVAPAESSLIQADAGIILEFKKKGGIIFKASGVTYPSIKDKIKLNRDIIDLFLKGMWLKDWAVVTEVAKAESSTIIISKSSNSKVELKAKGEIKAGNINIADTNLDFDVTFSGDFILKIIAEQTLTPLFNVSKLMNKGILPSNLHKNKPNLNQLSSMDLVTPHLAKDNPDMIFLNYNEFKDFYENV